MVESDSDDVVALADVIHQKFEKGKAHQTYVGESSKRNRSSHLSLQRRCIDNFFTLIRTCKNQIVLQSLIVWLLIIVHHASVM